MYEKQKTVYVRSVTGFFSNWRRAMVFFTQALFYGLCWLEWGGRQAVLFQIDERKFYIFGLVFWPQDVIYLAILLERGAGGRDPVGTMATIQRLHQVLLGVSLIVVLGAVAGSHGGVFFG